MVEHIRLNNVNRPNAELNKKIQYAKSGSTVLTTALLVIMLGYFFFPVLWLAIDTTKSTEQLFTTPMLAFPNHWNLISNLKTLSTYKGGEFWRWIFNSVIYAVVTAVVGALLSAMVGYVLAKYHFKGHGTVFWLVLSALMVPSAVLVVPIFI